MATSKARQPVSLGALFAAFREVVAGTSGRASWIELLHHTNQRLCAWSARLTGQSLPSMEIRSTCRGAVFAPSDLLCEGGDEVAPPRPSGSTTLSLAPSPANL